MQGGLKERIANELSRVKNRKLLDAAMAAAALVSTADEEVRLSEQVVLDRVLESLDDLKVYDPHLGVDLHRGYVEEIRADVDLGSERAYRSVSRFRGDSERATLLLSIAVAMAKADSSLCEAERRVLERLCEELGLPPDETLASVLE